MCCMKQRLITILAGLFLFAVCCAGCGQEDSASSQTTQSVQNSQEQQTSSESSSTEESQVQNAQATSTVYMTTNISPEGLMAAYQALNWTPTGNVAVKLSTGEPPASNYLSPDLIKDLV